MSNDLASLIKSSSNLLLISGARDADRDAEADPAGAGREHQEAARDAAEQGRR